MALVAVGAPTAASAQNIATVTGTDLSGLTLEDGNADTDNEVWTINIADCIALVADNPTLTFEWTLQTAAEGNYGIKLQRPETSCDGTDPTETAADTSEGCDVLADNRSLQSATTVTLEVSLNDILGFSDPGECTTRAASSSNYDVQFVVQDPSTETSTYDYYQMRFTLDTSRPTTPSVSEIFAGSSLIRVKFTEDSDTDIQYRAYYATSPFTADELPEEVDATRTSVRAGTPIDIESSAFVVGSTYYVAVVAVDGVGNQSRLSTPTEVTIIETVDFFERYNQLGGVEQGGYCAAAPVAGQRGLGLMVFGALALVGAGARRRVR